MLLYFWMMVQIICESLPISSSGHVVLLQQIFEKYNVGGQADFVMNQNLWAFDYILQGISAIIILLYFFPSWWRLIVGKPLRISSLINAHLWLKTIPKVFIFGVVADGVTLVFWLLHIADRAQLPLAGGFMITAAALWSMQYAHEKKGIDVWSWKHALLVGFVQGCALLPGVSRFGTTVAVLQWLGYQGRVACAISFLIQWPLIVAGSLAGFYALQDQSIFKIMCSGQFLVIVVIAGYCAYKLLCWVNKLIDKNLLWKFSYYMIIPSIVALWM